MNHYKAHLRIFNFTIAFTYNRALKQVIFWIGKREFPGSFDIGVGKWRYPKI